MRVIKSIKQLRVLLAGMRQNGKTIGFVPTMGCLHEGHLALLRKARKENDICVVSIYVNPAQFGLKEDLKHYPRDLKRDSTLLEKENVDICFIPSDNDIYPYCYLTYIDVFEISNVLCGAYRPGHFRGVATIVAKLLNVVVPQVMYLGAKDAQQVVVLETMVRDLNFPVRVSVVPTVREKDGLAMSSRNVYLTHQERVQAAVLHQSLQRARGMIALGEKKPVKIISSITEMISSSDLAKIQYVACVDAHTLKPLTRLREDVLIAVAVYFGKTRLIDNVLIKLKR